MLTLLLGILGTAASLTYDAPKEWTSASAGSSMRLAQWRVGEQSEVVIFYFGPGQGGSTEANIERWMGQFEQPDGSSTKDRAKKSETKAGDSEGNPRGHHRHLRRARSTGRDRAPQRAGHPNDRHRRRGTRRALVHSFPRASEGGLGRGTAFRRLPLVAPARMTAITSAEWTRGSWRAPSSSLWAHRDHCSSS